MMSEIKAEVVRQPGCQPYRYESEVKRTHVANSDLLTEKETYVEVKLSKDDKEYREDWKQRIGVKCYPVSSKPVIYNGKEVYRPHCSSLSGPGCQNGYFKTEIPGNQCIRIPYLGCIRCKRDPTLQEEIRQRWRSEGIDCYLTDGVEEPKPSHFIRLCIELRLPSQPDEVIKVYTDPVFDTQSIPILTGIVPDTCNSEDVLRLNAKNVKTGCKAVFQNEDWQKKFLVKKSSNSYWVAGFSANQQHRNVWVTLQQEVDGHLLSSDRVHLTLPSKEEYYGINQPIGNQSTALPLSTAGQTHQYNCRMKRETGNEDFLNLHANDSPINCPVCPGSSELVPSNHFSGETHDLQCKSQTKQQAKKIERRSDSDPYCRPNRSSSVSKPAAELSDSDLISSDDEKSFLSKYNELLPLPQLSLHEVMDELDNTSTDISLEIPQPFAPD